MSRFISGSVSLEDIAGNKLTTSTTGNTFNDLLIAHPSIRSTPSSDTYGPSGEYRGQLHVRGSTDGFNSACIIVQSQKYRAGTDNRSALTCYHDALRDTNWCFGIPYNSRNLGVSFSTTTAPDVDMTNSNLSQRFNTDGGMSIDGTYLTSGADYAEMFEWLDGNPKNEDRIGQTIVLEGSKIRPAKDEDLPSQIIGVISGTPTMIGNEPLHWQGKYERDPFGRAKLMSDGSKKVQNAYDPTREYVERRQRSEWGCVGLMGQLWVKLDQPLGDRWIVMSETEDLKLVFVR